MNSSLKTVVDIAQKRAGTDPKGVGFTFSDSDDTETQLTHYEFDQRARAIAAHLTEQNLVGRRALLLYLPGFDYLSAFYGCLYAGVVAVPAYPPDPMRIGRTLPRLMNIIKDSQSAAVLTTRAIDDMAESLFASSQPDQDLRWIATDEIDPSLAKQYQKPRIRASDLAFLQYTSGSTSNPRGVMLSHENIVANLNLSVNEMKLDDDTRVVSWLPPYHDMGLLGGMILPVYKGFHSTLMSPLDFLSNPFKWLRLFSEHKGTASAGPNFAYDLCVRRVTDQQRESIDLSTWAVAVNGAEPVRPDTVERFCERFAPCGFRRDAMMPSYGLAETTLYVTGASSRGPQVMNVDQKKLEEGFVKLPYDESDPTCRPLVSCGMPSIHYKVKIVDRDSHEILPENRVGEIWLQHESVSKGYWNQPELNAQTFGLFTEEGEGPFMRSGDVGFIHNRELFVAGRMKDIIIIRGRNHYPQDIEETLENCHKNVRPGCLAAFCIQTEKGDGLAVVLEVKRSSDEDIKETIDAIKVAVSTQHDINVDALALIESKTIPKTSSGKIQRHACKQMLEDGSLETLHVWRRHQTNAIAEKPAKQSAPKPETCEAHTDYMEALICALGINKDQNINPDELLVQHGMDSLIRQEIIVALEDLTGERLPDTLIDEKTTFRSLVAYLEANYDKGSGISSTIASHGRPESLDDLPEQFFNFDKLPAYVEIENQKKAFNSLGLSNPFFTAHDGIAKETTQIDGHSYVNFSSYNYLGLAGHPEIQRAAKAAIDQYGTGACASRLVSGERPIHIALERKLAEFTGVEDSIVFVGGHSTNVTTIGHLFGEKDLILLDSLSHDSVLQGAKLSGARILPFPHNDWRALDQILAKHRLNYEKVVVIIEGVYSMDGDIPDLRRFIEVKKRHRAFLMVDEAHSSGVLGKTGRGIAEYADVSPSEVDIWMGTLSKSFVSCGGYIAGCKSLIEYLRYSAPGFVFSVGMPPVNAASSLKAIDILLREPERVQKLHYNSELFLSLAKEANLDTGPSADSPVVPVILGNSMSTLLLSQKLLEEGFNVRPIVYPAVEDKASRLRFFITASHTEKQIRDSVKATKKLIDGCMP